MKNRLSGYVAILILVVPGVAHAGGRFSNTWYGRVAAERSQYIAWHGDYYHTAWGAPVALVVPPTAEMTTNYHWGVSGLRVTPIDHQFARPYPGPGPFGGGAFYGTPLWPTDTNQYGVYYVRGPW